MGEAGGRGGSSSRFRASDRSMKLRMAVTLGITLGLGCDRPMAPTTGTGGVTLRILSASDSGPTPLDFVRIVVRGPTNRTMDAFPGTTVSIGGLTPGTYTVALEGFILGEVDRFGETGPVSVLAGQNTIASVAFATFVPVVSLPTSAKGFSFTVTYGSVAGAAFYQVEVASDPSFTTNRISVATVGASAQVTVPNYGGYYVRIRAIDGYEARGRPSA